MSDSSELRGAKAVIAALVKKYGPFELSVDEIMSVDHDLGRIEIANGPDGFAYRYKAPVPRQSEDGNG